MNKIEQIKKYLDTILPSKSGTYKDTAENKGDIVTYSDISKKILIKFSYSSFLSNYKFLSKEKIIEGLDNVMGKSASTGLVETYPSRGIQYVTVVYDYVNVEDQVTSKGFRTLLGLK